VNKDEWTDMRVWKYNPCVKAEVKELIPYTNRTLGSHNTLFSPKYKINRKLKTQ